ncbi:MAG: M20/M25/M40 family metallo-hydrolase [Caulobacteraceae bacterium]|nr:M20/M25/M40 family metallo-hydrolase [Caulobacteraceae bacterium]
MKLWAGLAAAGILATAAPPVLAQAPAPQPRPDQLAFRDLYKELVETNTTLSVGDCTAAAAKMQTRLKAAGFADADLVLFSPLVNPRWGGLVAVLHGTDPKAKALLLLAHIDVVEAKREDWVRDPFKLTEENGVFYGRGASDDKAEASVWVDSLIRMKTEGYKPRRTIKMALTCGEETSENFDGADWLAKNRRDLIDAEFALNEGAGGRLDEAGHYIALNVQDGEKVYQNFKLETTNAGGHSSIPIRDNAIYHLAGGLARLQNYDFPVRLNDGNRAYFNGMSALVGGEVGAAMKAVAADPNNAAAAAIVSRDRSWNSMLRTTCVATLLSGGHAPNALPQRAGANVNCRIFPGQSVEDVRQTLIQVLNDPAISVSVVQPESPTPGPPPLTAQVLEPIQKSAAKIWPGVPVVPMMSTGATDGIYLTQAGIPTYGVSGFFVDPAGSGAHGLNEHIRVQSLYEGRDFLYGLIKLYAMQK